MSQEENQNRVDIKVLQTKFDYIESTLKENTKLLQSISDKLDVRLSKVENNVSSLKGQLKLIAGILSTVVATIIGLLFFKI
jgi:hypothetical protein